MATINDLVQVLRDLKDLEAEGVVLPLPRKRILQIELRGHMVDLETGEIIMGSGGIGASCRRYRSAQARKEIGEGA